MKLQLLVAVSAVLWLAPPLKLLNGHNCMFQTCRGKLSSPDIRPHTHGRNDSRGYILNKHTNADVVVQRGFFLPTVLVELAACACLRELNIWGTDNKAEGLSFGDDVTSIFLSQAVALRKDSQRQVRQYAAQEVVRGDGAATLSSPPVSAMPISGAGIVGAATFLPALSRDGDDAVVPTAATPTTAYPAWLTGDIDASVYGDSDPDDERIGGGMALCRSKAGTRWCYASPPSCVRMDVI
jgi:hypothetical protein